MFDEIFIREMSPIDAYNYGRQMMEKEINKLGECEYNKGRADAFDDFTEWLSDSDLRDVDRVFIKNMVNKYLREKGDK